MSISANITFKSDTVLGFFVFVENVITIKNLDLEVLFVINMPDLK